MTDSTQINEGSEFTILCSTVGSYEWTTPRTFRVEGGRVLPTQSDTTGLPVLRFGSRVSVNGGTFLLKPTTGEGASLLQMN